MGDAMGLQSARVNGFDHTRVYVSDMARSRAFYEGVLDLQVHFENPRQDSEGIARIFGREGAAVHLTMGRIAGHVVELIKVLDEDPPQAPGSYVGGSGFTVTVEDIDAAYEAVRASGVTVLNDIVDVKGTRIFFIADPDGMRIELIQYADGHHVTWPTTS
jgi:catechol 2,3-dioxygenase-like lactoylglutathione lyase family enzyme